MNHKVAPPITRAGRKTENEDDIWVWSTQSSSDSSRSILAVADGMGGHEHGAKASGIAIRALKEAVEEWQEFLWETEEIQEEFHRLFERIDKALRIYAREHAENETMGTTFVVAILVDQDLHLAHIGDSRAYWVRENGEVEQLTQDHSAAAEAVREGRMTEEEAAQSPYQHTLTRSLDGSGDSSPDCLKRKVRAPGFLCLCSDGLSGAISKEDFAQVLLRDVSLAESAESLVDLAEAKESMDNITLAALRCGDVDPKEEKDAIGAQKSPEEETDIQDYPGRSSSWLWECSFFEKKSIQSAEALLGVFSALTVGLFGLYAYTNIMPSEDFHAGSNQSELTSVEQRRSSDTTEKSAEVVPDYQDKRIPQSPKESSPSEEYEEEETEAEGKVCKTVFATSHDRKSLVTYRENISKKIKAEISPFYRGDKIVYKIVSQSLSIKEVKKGDKIGLDILKEEGVYGVVKKNVNINDEEHLPYKHCFN